MLVCRNKDFIEVRRQEAIDVIPETDVGAVVIVGAEDVGRERSPLKLGICEWIDPRADLMNLENRALDVVGDGSCRCLANPGEDDERTDGSRRQTGRVFVELHKDK